MQRNNYNRNIWNVNPYRHHQNHNNIWDHHVSQEQGWSGWNQMPGIPNNSPYYLGGEGQQFQLSNELLGYTVPPHFQGFLQNPITPQNPWGWHPQSHVAPSKRNSLPIGPSRNGANFHNNGAGSYQQKTRSQPGASVVAKTNQDGKGNSQSASRPSKERENFGRDDLDLEPHFEKFKELYMDFVKVNDPSPLLPELVEVLMKCCSRYAYRYVNSITHLVESVVRNTIKDNVLVPAHLRMRSFWLIGTIYKKEYDHCFQKLRSFLKGSVLFRDFLNHTQVNHNFKPELQAIYSYWKAVVPKKVMKIIRWNGWETNAPFYPSMECFYSKTKADGRPMYNCQDISKKKKKKGKNRRNQFAVSGSDTNQNVSSTYNNVRTVSQQLQNLVVSPPVEKSSFITQNQRQVANVQTTRAHTQPKKTVSFPLSEEMRLKFVIFTAKLNNLLSMERSGKVLKVLTGVIEDCLDLGGNENLSNKIIYSIRKRIDGKESKQPFVPQKTIRILWIVGYLFLPANSIKVPYLKTYLETIAHNLFLVCLDKITDDDLAREEMRVILKFWDDVMGTKIMLAIYEQFKNPVTSKPHKRYKWILKNNDIREYSRMQEFYNNAYLKPLKSTDKVKDVSNKESGPHPLQKNLDENSNMPAKESPAYKGGCIDISKDSDEETEITLLDKRDIIDLKYPKGDETLKVKKPTGLTDQDTKKKKKQEVYQESAKELFSDFIRIPSQPKPSKPVDLPSRIPLANDVGGLIGAKLSSNFKKPSDLMGQSKSNSFSACHSSTGSSSATQNTPTISKLEQFRKQMEKDAAITSLSFTWNDSLTSAPSKEIYLRTDWTVHEFVDHVCSDNMESWDIVELPNGETRVKIVRK